AWFRRLSLLTLLNWRSFEIWPGKVCWSSPAEAEEFLWSGGTGDCKASRRSSTRIAPLRGWLHASAWTYLLFLPTPTTCIWTTRNQRSVRCGTSARRSWTSTQGLAISHPGIWAQKSNPCCAFCATAGRKLLLFLAGIGARRLSDLPAHTCFPIATVRK